MVNTTNLIDRFLDSLRKKAFADFLETNESRIVKAGLICLSYVIPAVSLIAVISLLIRTDLEAGILLIPVAVCVASILLRYAAEKMLGCVKESIDNAKTQISSSSLLDVFTVFIGCFGILVLLASIAGGKNAFYVGIFVFIACEYCMAILLDPTKTINVAI